MSSVIKNSQMLFSPPIIIDVFEPARISESELILVDKSEDINPLDVEEQQLERIRQESQTIFQETEQMVMELLGKARAEARDIIGDAREEAEIIKLQATEEAAQIKLKTQQEAYEEGLKRAQAEIEADRQTAMQQRQEILEEARQAKLKLFRSSEADMVRLVIAIAKKVIAGELHTNPALIINVLQEAIEYLDRPENITVYVNPQDIENVLEVINSGNLTDIGSNGINIELKADDRITAGGGILESNAGMVDAQLETRIASVSNAIQEAAADEY